MIQCIFSLIYFNLFLQMKHYHNMHATHMSIIYCIHGQHGGPFQLLFFSFQLLCCSRCYVISVLIVLLGNKLVEATWAFVVSIMSNCDNTPLQIWSRLTLKLSTPGLHLMWNTFCLVYHSRAWLNGKSSEYFHCKTATCLDILY